VRVLIAEDDAVSRLILQRSIESIGHSTAIARDGIEAWEAYLADPPDVLISDWLMPGIEGIELCRRVRGHGAKKYTYFVFMTSLAGKQDFLKGMEAGADDYLIKPVDADDLRVRLIAASRVTSLHARLVEQNAELERLGRASFEAARIDPLTKVSNRLRLREDLEAMRPRVLRYGHTFSAALCDVDHFKKYNDHHGHLAGDEALRRVAETISKELRSGDAVYRYGGEEFLVILPEQNHAGAMAAMERVRGAIERLALPHEAIPRKIVTISAGVAMLEKGDGPPWEAWLKRSDQALYLAKEAGRNVVRAWARAAK
jgi:two-component system, cell cycle response regulator